VYSIALISKILDIPSLIAKPNFISSGQNYMAYLTTKCQKAFLVIQVCLWPKKAGFGKRHG
jgi:hypothetical protein